MISLADNFIFALDAVLIVLAKLHVVVYEADRAKPDCGEEHQEHIQIR